MLWTKVWRRWLVFRCAWSASLKVQCSLRRLAGGMPVSTGKSSLRIPWGTWHIISELSEKVGGRVPRVPHLIAPVCGTNSNNRVISSGDLYFCMLPQCEALCTCCSGFPITTQKIYSLSFACPANENDQRWTCRLLWFGFKSCDVPIYWWIWVLSFFLSRFGLELMIFFWTSLQLLVHIGTAGYCIDRSFSNPLILFTVFA